MATMKLDLGGAETHIVELARALHLLGHRITVVSAGGLFVETLEGLGIRHVEAPLDSRHPASMAKARGILARTLDEVRPDVVHNHARIPGFLLSALCRRRGIPLVSTVHGSYKVSASLRLLTRWGSKALTVSSDLSSYLVDNYGFSQRDIFPTINGINTALFSFDAAAREAVRASFGILPDQPMVLTVSRLDPDASGGVRHLLEEAPLLHRRRPDACIVVVGGGAEFEELAQRADRLNREADSPYLIMTGPRADVAALCSAADVFVGVSRAALEAMSCGRPVVLAGTAGYLGILDDSTLGDAMDTNLTCRGFAYPAQPCIAEDVLALLRDPPLCLALGAKGRAVVETHYSADRMAADALTCYRAALNAARRARYDFLLCGYYGYGNAGDELLLSTIVDNLSAQDPEAAICVLNRSRDQASCSRQVALARRFSPMEVLSAMRRSSVLLFGGGNLLQDVTSKKSLYYYLGLLWLARRQGCRTMLYGNGIGPLGSTSGQKLSAKVLRQVDCITLRDPDSLQLLRRLGLPEQAAQLTADEVFTALQAPLPRVEGLPERPYLAVSLRSWTKNDPAFVPKLAGALDQLADETGLPVLLVPFQPTADSGICRQVAAAMSQPSTLFHGSSAEVLSAVTNARIVVGMRLHALVFATAAGLPSVGIVYDEKVRALLSMLGRPREVDCEQLDQAQLMRHVLDIHRQYEEEAVQTLDAAARLRAQAEQNAQAAYRLLREGRQHT